MTCLNLEIIHEFYGNPIFGNKDNTEGDSLQWPNGQKAAVSLTYDDGLDCHLDIVVPDLEKYNLRGSFFLTGNSTSVGSRLEEWREIAARGHELGNHSLFHSCGEAGEHNKESIHELRIMNTLLKAIDGKKERTYAYPCREAHEGLLQYLDDNRDVYWIDTFFNISRFLNERLNL